jgi:hypothetical protein
MFVYDHDECFSFILLPSTHLFYSFIGAWDTVMSIILFVFTGMSGVYDDDHD